MTPDEKLEKHYTERFNNLTPKEKETFNIDMATELQILVVQEYSKMISKLSENEITTFEHWFDNLTKLEQINFINSFIDKVIEKNIQL